MSAGRPTLTEQGPNHRAGSWQTRAERKAEVLKSPWETGTTAAAGHQLSLQSGERTAYHSGDRNMRCAMNQKTK